MRIFEPWIGDYYEAGLDGVKVLILGESHYGPPAKQKPSYTRDMVARLALERSHRFFSTVQRLMQGLSAGTKLHTTVRRRFWERVAFYNYVQQFVGERARCRPSVTMWQDAETPFLNTLSELSPHFLLVLGDALRKNLPILPSGLAVCIINHPSSWGFRKEEWGPEVKAALQSVRDTRSSNRTSPGA